MGPLVQGGREWAFLSVTPHIQPTHTRWTPEGKRQLPQFNPSTTYDVPLDQTTPTEELLGRHLEATEALAARTEAAAAAQRELAGALRKALAVGDKDAAREARDKMWEALFPMFAESAELAQAWNDLTSRLASEEQRT